MLDLIEIRTKVEKAFEGFDFTDKCVGTDYRVSKGSRSISVVLHDLKGDMYVNYKFSTSFDDSSIVVIGPDDEAVTTYHSHEEIIKAMIKNMKEWGVDYDNI